MALAAIVATAATLLVGSAAYAATGNVVRKPGQPGQLAYGLSVTVTYTSNAPTTEWRMEFDLPADQQVVSFWSTPPFTRSGNHWTGIYRAASPMVAGQRVTTNVLIYGTADPANCRIDGNPCAYSVESDTQPPTVPTRLFHAYQANPPGVTVYWTASSDNVGVAGYEVSVNGQVIGTTTATSLNVGPVTPPVPWSVRAFDVWGNYSAAATATITPYVPGPGPL